MASHGFKTVPDELMEHAHAVAAWHEDHGFSVRPEPSDPAYPNTPTLRCRRPPTRVFVEVTGSLSMVRAESWMRFGKSCTSDTRVIFAIPDSAPRSSSEEGRLQEMGIGLYISGPNGVREALAAHDLAVNVSLPTLESLPKQLKPLLGPVYEQFDRSQWREGFETACQVLQVESAKYLNKGIASERVTVLDSLGRKRTLTPATVENMTLGQLGVTFSNIELPNQLDSVLAEVLGKINKDRVGVAHKKHKRLTETRLRRNVGQHMYRVITALKAALEIT